MSLRCIKLVTFDVTNTILKFRVPPWEYYAAVAQNFGYTVDAQQVKSQLLGSFKPIENQHPNYGKDDITWVEWWKKLVRGSFTGLLPPTADVDCIADKLIEDFKTPKCWKPVKGGKELLDILRNRNINVGVISNFDPRLHELLDNIGFGNYFDFVVTSYEAGYSKPEKQIFNHAMKYCKCSISPSECLHIGDDLKKDYEGAKAAGWHALLVTANLTETPPACKHVFKDLEALTLAIHQDKLML